MDMSLSYNVMIRFVGNIRCGGNDLPFGSYTAEWNSLGGD